MIRPIVVMGDPILKQMAREVTLEELRSPAIQSLIDDMLATLKASKTGVGLAAPQISESLRIVVIADPTTVLVNPVITPVSDLMDVGSEGCLSVPGMQGDVRRHRTVRVQALGRNGKTIDAIWTKFRAVVVQHEVDHLNGILYVERAEYSTPTDTTSAAVPSTGAGPGGSSKRQTIVIDSESEVGGKRHINWTFNQRGRVVGLRIQPGGAVVTGAFLSGVKLRAKGYKAGAAEKMLLGPHGLHVSAGDQLRLELNIEKGRKRIIAEADVDWAS